MKSEIENKKEDYKEKLALITAKRIIKDTQEIREELTLNKTVLSWLSDIETDSEFINKYFHFDGIKELIYQYNIFHNTKIIEKNKNEELIESCINDFHSIIKDENYNELSSKAGYSLPESFGIHSNYLNNSLKAKVRFFEKFYREIEDISLNMINKKEKVK